MRNNKPKGKTPSLIGGSLGTPRPKVVERLCKCKRCNSPLVKGTSCFEIPQLGGAFANCKPYCSTCFKAILEQTQSDVTALFESL